MIAADTLPADAPINNFETNTRGRHSGAQPPRPDMAKRVMDVEQALSWAFRQELPKNDGLSGGHYGPPAYVSPLARMVSTGGVQIDNWHREPGFPSAMGAPHPDALLIEQALRAVTSQGTRIDCLSGELRLVPELPALGIEEVEAVRVALASVEAIVGRCAKLQERPFWTRDTVPRPMRHANGRTQVARWERVTHEDPFGNPVEHEVLVHVGAEHRGEYPEGAYCPLRYDPEPQSIAGERAEWLVWWGALDAIATALSGKLATIAILPPSAPQRPWMGDEELGMPPRIFEDLRGRVYQSEQRETAAAHRALGLRAPAASRSGARRRGLPTRIVRPSGPVRTAACQAV